MKREGKHTMEKCMRSLGRMGVIFEGKKIIHAHVKHIGIKSYGKIDYLLHYEKFYHDGWIKNDR